MSPTRTRPTDAAPFAATNLASRYDGTHALPVTVILDNVRSLYNVGAFFRTADAVRLERLWLCGITARPPRPEIAKTALGAEHTVPWSEAEDAASLAATLRSQGYAIAAVETSLHAVDLFEWQPSFPVCVAFGHEVNGVSPAALDCCDAHIRIPMFGFKQSLNVATAGGVVLYELLRKYRALCDGAAPGAGAQR